MEVQANVGNRPRDYGCGILLSPAINRIPTGQRKTSWLSTCIANKFQNAGLMGTNRASNQDGTRTQGL